MSIGPRSKRPHLPSSDVRCPDCTPLCPFARGALNAGGQAKQRALIYVDMGDFTHAVTGLRADLAEHHLTKGLMSSGQALRGRPATGAQPGAPTSAAGRGRGDRGRGRRRRPQDARGRSAGQSADRLRLSLLSERPRPHPHAGRAYARRIARDPSARRRARGGSRPRRGGVRACRHHRRRGRLHGEPPDLARRIGRDARRRNCAPSISPTRRAMLKSSPPPSALSSRARRGRVRRPSRSSSSRAFGARFNSGVSFRWRSARG